MNKFLLTWSFFFITSMVVFSVKLHADEMSHQEKSQKVIVKLTEEASYRDCKKEMHLVVHVMHSTLVSVKDVKNDQEKAMQHYEREKTPLIISACEKEQVVKKQKLVELGKQELLYADDVKGFCEGYRDFRETMKDFSSGLMKQAGVNIFVRGMLNLSVNVNSPPREYCEEMIKEYKLPFRSQRVSSPTTFQTGNPGGIDSGK